LYEDDEGGPAQSEEPGMEQGFFLSRYELGQCIGQGAYGKVSVVRRREDGLLLCAKQIQVARMTDKEKTEAEREARRLRPPGCMRRSRPPPPWPLCPPSLGGDGAQLLSGHPCDL
jgi:hypothetical protein